jgi:hypothetical protein
VPALDLHRDVLEEADAVVALVLGGAVAGELDEVEGVVDRDGAREVGDERDARLQRGDEDRLEAFVVGGDLRSELRDPARQLVRVEENLADSLVEDAQEAFRSPYRCASRSKSRS